MATAKFRIGDYARNVESGWIGKIVAFKTDHNGDNMAEMIGVDFLAHTIAGLSMEEALSADDVQWHAPADLIPINPYLTDPEAFSLWEAGNTAREASERHDRPARLYHVTRNGKHVSYGIRFDLTPVKAIDSYDFELLATYRNGERTEH